MAMEKNILTINIGSSSKKYALVVAGTETLSAHFEKNNNGFLVSYSTEAEIEISETEYNESLTGFSNRATSLLVDKSINAIGFRVVAPGTYFTEDHVVDQEFLDKLKALENKDKAHIGPMLVELQQIKSVFPDIKIVAVSDSAFHKNLSPVVKNYSIPAKFSQEMDLYRFGYHGISLTSIVESPVLSDVIKGRIIVCHLGSGASVTAIKDGKSLDTSMGYLPLNGPIMSSRVGDIDSGAVMSLVESGYNISDLFYKESGLLGISELSSDMRVLLDAEQDGNTKAGLAVKTFVYDIQKYIGAYAAAMGGLDAVVFSGTIGERSYVLRERICELLAFLGIEIDTEKNKQVKSDSQISAGQVSVFVVHTNESKVVADTTLKYL